MKKKDVTIQLANGVEASPIALLVQKANCFSSSIYFELNEAKVNAKSIMGMLSMAMNYGDTIQITADGEDEDEALLALEEFLSQK